LFDDTPCRRLWLERLASLVRRWATRPAIVGWEIFSELDLVTGATEGRAVKFVERAAAVIRTSDPAKRPVMASQAGVHEWPKLLASPALDVIQIHPYAAGPYGGKLDELILKSVRDRLRTYGKPVLIGESGLDHAPPRGTLDASPRAEIGIRHAIWAALVSGAMNGRALWWQDGYDIFEKVALTSRYERAAAGAAAFARHVDYSGFAPVASQLSTNLFGAALGSRRQVIVWVRDAACQPPEWPIRTLSGEQVMLDAANGAWEVEIFDPETGQSTGHANLTATTGKLRVPLPEFRGAVALKAVNID
jgi:hypothetical protein